MAPSTPIHTVYCHVMASEWSVTFLEADYKTPIGPWLLCKNAEEVEAILRWGRAGDEALEEHRRNLKRWGVGGAALKLTSLQRMQLIERRVGWPWNGYELAKMKRDGRYPPQRLTSSQEEEFMRRRRA